MTPWEAYKQRLGTTRPWDLVNPNIPKATDEVADERLHICDDCAHLTITRQCTQCGCFMNGKVKLKDAECPIGKW